MKNISLLLIFLASTLSGSAVAMERTSQERFERSKIEKKALHQFFEERYQGMAEQGFSDTDILKIANEGPAVLQLILRDCKKDGKVSPSTASRTVQLTLDQLIKKDHSTREQIRQEIEERATNEENCSDANLLVTEQMLVLTKEFQEFVHQKQNSQK